MNVWRNFGMLELLVDKPVAERPKKELLRLWQMLQQERNSLLKTSPQVSPRDTGCPKNGVLTVHYGVEETTVNVRKMLKKFYWTYLLIWQSLKVAFNR
jgi:hypothetical protein